MARKPGPAGRGASTPASRQAAGSLSAALDALSRAGEQLAKSSAGGRASVQDGSAGASPDAGRAAPPAVKPAPAQSAPQEESFYRMLEQTGQLTDVDENTDLSTLPARITHIRHPDGRIERLQFTANPYAGLLKPRE